MRFLLYIISATVTILANDGSAGEVNFETGSLKLELREPTLNNQTGMRAEVTIRRGPGIYGRITVPFIITTQLNVLTVDITPSSGVIVFEDRQVQMMRTIVTYSCCVQ